MSFNNGANNVALYTNDTANTNYYVDGVISYRTTGTGTNENIKAKGTQDKNNIYGKKNFFWNDGASANSEGVKVSDDWFVSLDAPYANAADPYAVAASLRAADGSVDLGNFMKLSDTGVAALAAAGLESSEVAAGLDGSYEAVKDEREIAGSADAAKEDEEAEDPVEEEIKGEFVVKYGKTYFVTEEGTKLTGLNKIDGKWYFFKDNGQLVFDSFHTFEDDTKCYFGSDGAMLINYFITRYGSTYFVGEDGAMLRDGKYAIGDKYYFFNEKGQMLKGKFARIGDDRYFFGDDGAMLTLSFVSQYGSKYYLGEDGAVVKNTVFTVDGVTYSANADGKLKVKK
jgi:hypothetical protein